MQYARMPASRLRFAALLAALAAPLAPSGCGMPGTPQPPSLELPEPVGDLAAVRSGNQVALTWTMPTRDTDKVPLNGNVTVRVCRNQSGAQGCATVATLRLSPGANAAFTGTLPPELAEGAPRLLTYFVELDNRKGRSAGLSNSARIPAGEAPPAVEGLVAEMRRNGVLLRWTPAPPHAAPAAVRFVRKLVAPPANQAAASKSSKGSIAAQREPPVRTLLVAPGPHLDRALDDSIELGATYEYRAQRVARVTIDGESMNLAGPLSLPLRVAAMEIYPPAAPSGLAAVATAGTAGTGPAIDLNWQPNTETDLAGYIVYRREIGAAAIGWQRVSPAQLVVAPAYHDANVQPGHTYRYAVSAVNQRGSESARSTEAVETVPEP